VAKVLASRSRGSSGGRDALRLRAGLTITQLALAVTLVVASGLLVKSLRGLYGTDTGVDPEGVLVMDVYPTAGRYPDDNALWTFYDEVLDRVRVLPGVMAAGMTAELPVADDFGCWVQGFEDPSVADRIEDAGQTTCAGQEPTTPGYFEAMGIPVVAGRGLEDADNDEPGRAAVVVSEAFAERFWPGESPIGKGVNPGGRTSPPFYHVVGVVGDVAARVGEDQAPLSQKAIAIYYPIRYNPGVAGNRYWWPGNLRLVVKTSVAEPSSLFPAIRAVVAELDPEVPVGSLTDMEAITASAMTRISFVSLLLGIAAAEALLLAAVGLYGMISYGVGRRTREIGMRMAIGARPGEVERMVVVQSLTLAGAGLAVGVVLALATMGLMEGLLVGVRPTDPVVFVGASLLLALIATVAAWIPARRAAHLDPAQALRGD
jgi:predicted permease